MWYSPMGLMITLVVGYCASLLFRKFGTITSLEPEPNLFTPWLANKIRQRRADFAKTSTSQVFVLEEVSKRS